MKRIRIGKDITCNWSITTNGAVVDLDLTKLSVVLVAPNGTRTTLTDVTAEGNVLTFAISHDLQTALGVYRLELWQDLGKTTQTAVDHLRAFQLVPYTTMEGGDEEDNIETETSADLGSDNLIIGTSVIDNLTSTSTIFALSANQGRVLNSIKKDLINRQSFTGTDITLEASSDDKDWICKYTNPLTSLTLTFGTGKGEYLLYFTTSSDSFTATIADCTIIGDTLSFDKGKSYLMGIVNKTIVLTETTAYSEEEE